MLSCERLNASYKMMLGIQYWTWFERVTAFDNTKVYQLQSRVPCRKAQISLELSHKTLYSY